MLDLSPSEIGDLCEQLTHLQETLQAVPRLRADIQRMSLMRSRAQDGQNAAVARERQVRALYEKERTLVRHLKKFLPTNHGDTLLTKLLKNAE